MYVVGVSRRQLNSGLAFDLICPKFKVCLKEKHKMSLENIFRYLLLSFKLLKNVKDTFIKIDKKKSNTHNHAKSNSEIGNVGNQ